MARFNAKLNAVNWLATDLPAAIYIIVINVFYSTTMVKYEHLPAPHIRIIDRFFLSLYGHVHK